VSKQSRSIALAALFAGLACAQPIPLTWRTGTLTRVASGEEYLGTYSAGSAGGGFARALSIPIVRNDQVYVIAGGGMEYVVVERKAGPAHVVVNAAIAYAVQGEQFYFADEERRSHVARIARQTLVDPGAVAVIEPTVWKEVNGGSRYFVRRSEGSIYAEQILPPRKKAVPVKFEAVWQENQYVGHMHWVEGKCSLSSEVDLRMSPGRIEGFFSFPVAGSKFDKKRCRYDETRAFPLLWVPE
jgi:hypothetical protein